MLKFNKIESYHRDYCLHYNDSYLYLDLVPSPITNKYNIIIDYIYTLSRRFGESFDIWFWSFLKEYHVRRSDRFILLMNNIDKIFYYVDSSLSMFPVDYSKFVNESKAKKNSIFFNEIDIEKIIKTSNYLKIYSVIFNTDQLRLDAPLHKKVYNEIIKKELNNDIIYRLFKVIKTKTFRYNLTDKYMWDYLKMVKCKEIDVHIMEIFNFLMNNILILCEENKNPITFFVTVVDESIKWFLRSVYKDTILYTDSIQTEDIQTLDVNNLKTYCYNDALGRIKSLSLSYVYSLAEKMKSEKFDDQELDPILNIQNKIENIEFNSPVVEFIVYPILSKVLGIPYKYFITIKPSQGVIISYYTYNLIIKVFGENRYKELFSLMKFYIIEEPITKTQYKMRGLKRYFEKTNINNFWGLKTKVVQNEIINTFVGKLSRIKLRNLLDDDKCEVAPIGKIEENVIDFYVDFFSGRLEKEFEQMRKILVYDF